MLVVGDKVSNLKNKTGFHCMTVTWVPLCIYSSVYTVPYYTGSNFIYIYILYIYIYILRDIYINLTHTNLWDHLNKKNIVRRN